MSEFLTNLSSGQPLLWAVFVLGVMAASAISLSAFWGAVYRVFDALRQRGRMPLGPFIWRRGIRRLAALQPRRRRLLLYLQRQERAPLTDDDVLS